MKILFVTDFYEPHIGGVEKLFATLSAELVAQGNDVIYITWLYDKQLPRNEIVNGVHVFRIGSPNRLFFSLLALPQIVKAARQTDIIHTSTYSAAIGAWIASKITKKPVFVTVHEVWGKLWMKLPYLSIPSKMIFRFLEWAMLSLKFDKYIAVSNFTHQSLIDFGIRRDRIEMIYNGIEYNLPQWSSPQCDFTFTFFGRGGVSKGIDLLLDAAELILESQPNVRFKFIVSPQIKSVFRSIIKRIESGKLRENATVLSNLTFDQLQIELLTSSCVVIPSYCEGFGFTAAEASAMHIPIISSGRGALPEVVSGSVISMESFDTNGLIVAMQRAINGQFLHVEDKKFEISAFVEKHIEVYKQLSFM